jgi:hypothetical protein
MVLIVIVLFIAQVTVFVSFFVGKHFKILGPQDIAMIMTLNNEGTARDTKSFLVVTTPFVQKSYKYPGRPQVYPITNKIVVELSDQLTVTFYDVTVTALIYGAKDCFLHCPGRLPEKAFRKLGPGRFSEVARTVTSQSMSDSPTALKRALVRDFKLLAAGIYNQDDLDKALPWGVRILDINFVYESNPVLDEVAATRKRADAQAYAANQASQQEVVNYRREIEAEGPVAWFVNQVGPWVVEAAKAGAFQFVGIGGDSESLAKIRALIKELGGDKNAKV